MAEKIKDPICGMEIETTKSIKLIQGALSIIFVAKIAKI